MSEIYSGYLRYGNNVNSGTINVIEKYFPRSFALFARDDRMAGICVAAKQMMVMNRFGKHTPAIQSSFNVISELFYSSSSATFGWLFLFLNKKI